MKHKYKPKQEISTASLKKQIRDTERLLKRTNLTATVQQELERRVKSLRSQLPSVETVVREREGRGGI